MGIPCKTAAGHAELVASERRLSQRHRTMLLLVDGHRTIDEVLKLAQQASVSRAYLDELLALGLVVLAAPMTAAQSLDGSTLPSSEAVPSGFTSFDPAHGLDTVGLGPAVSNRQLMRSEPSDQAFAEARRVLTQALLTGAPVSGAVTLLRVRRARDRHELHALLPEVQARLSRPQHLSQARQVVSRVERLLAAS